MNVIGIDLGTSGIRCALFAQTGEELDSQSSPTHLVFTGSGGITLDPEEYFTTLAATLGAMLARNRTTSVSAISFSVQGEAALFIDQDNTPLSSCPVSMDKTGQTCAEEFGQTFSKDTFSQITGQPVHPMFSIFKAAHYRPAHPGARFVSLDAYILGRLGFTPTTDWTLAARMGLWDVENRSWSPTLLTWAGLCVDTVSKVVPPGTHLGTTTTTASQLLGLPHPVEVTVGSHDQASAFWGAGCNTQGIGAYSMGSSDCLTQGSIRRPGLPTGSGLATYPVDKQLWLTLAGTAAGGWAAKWLAQTLSQPGSQDPLAALDQVTSPPSDVIVLPYHCGSGTLDNEPRARGVIANLDLTTSPDDIIRAALEASGFEMARIIKATQDIFPPLRELRVMGGGAKMQALQLRADALGRQLRFTTQNASLRGAAIQALNATGTGASQFSSSDLSISQFRAVDPQPTHLEFYRNKRLRYDAYAHMCMQVTTTIEGKPLCRNTEN